jgi:hypothetical protein
MPIVIEDFEIEVPSAESTPAPAGASPSAAPAWSAELARELEEQLRISLERSQRLLAD